MWKRRKRRKAPARHPRQKRTSEDRKWIYKGDPWECLPLSCSVGLPYSLYRSRADNRDRNTWRQSPLKYSPSLILSSSHNSKLWKGKAHIKNGSRKCRLELQKWAEGTYCVLLIFPVWPADDVSSKPLYSPCAPPIVAPLIHKPAGIKLVSWCVHFPFWKSGHAQL